MTDCIFCKIVKGEIPCYKICETENVFAFLDAYPLTDGHVLVIPKKHYVNVFDIDEKVLEEIISVSKRIAEKMKNEFGADAVNLLNASGKEAGQSVFHFHMHVVARRENDNLGFSKWWASNSKEGDKDQLKQIADKLKLC